MCLWFFVAEDVAIKLIGKKRVIQILKVLDLSPTSPARLHGCVDECPVHAIYAEGDLPQEFQSDIEFNATEARRVKESGQGAIETKKDPLPTAAQRKTELGY